MSIENQLADVMYKITKGTFVNENYLVQFGCVNSQNPIKRFFLYQSNCAEEWSGVDCDVSLAAVVTYGLMYDWLGVGANIQLQNRSLCKYKIISKQGNCYLGDTMTSAKTFFKRYLYLLWKNENVSAEYKALFEESNGNLAIPKDKDKNSYKKLFDYLEENLISNNEFLNIIDIEISGEAKNFLGNYLNAGNCIVVPENFNRERSGYGKLDTVDRILWKVYQYFTLKDDEYLCQLFVSAEDKENSIHKFKTWMTEAKISNWDEFITANVLEPFVDMEDNTKRPISMKTGFCIANNIVEDYKPMPESVEEFDIFFRNLNTRITLRSRLLWHMVRN